MCFFVVKQMNSRATSDGWKLLDPRNHKKPFGSRFVPLLSSYDIGEWASYDLRKYIDTKFQVLRSNFVVLRLLDKKSSEKAPCVRKPLTPFWDWLKGSVERSLLPWAIFLIFTRNRPWKSEDYLCTLFFIEMSKERLEKSERTPPVSWRPWALAYSPDRPYNFSCLSAVSKKRRFGSFSRLRGVIWRGKAFREQQCQFLTRNKSLGSENESNCSMTSECVRTDSILPRGAGLEHGRCKQSIFSLSIFGILVERLSF